MACAAAAWRALPARPTAGPPIDIPVHYTNVREAAGITFKQDSTQTEEKYYLETMGTGVGWIDYDQDGLMISISCNRAPPTFTSPLIRCAPPSITTTVTELLPMSRQKRAWGPKAFTARAWPWGTMITTAIPISTSPATAAPFFITTTATELSPTSPKKRALPTRADGPPAPAGLITTRMATSTSWCSTTSTGLPRIISGAASAAPATAPIATRIITRDKKSSSTTTITTARSPTSARNPAWAFPRPKEWGWCSPISTTTAGRTSPWPTTPGPISCLSTSTTELLKTYPSPPEWRPAKTANTKRVWALTPPTWMAMGGSIST